MRASCQGVNYYTKKEQESSFSFAAIFGLALMASPIIIVIVKEILC